jgi:hypothetical protein
VSAPVITATSHVQTRTTITLRVKYTTAYYAGRLYCAAFAPGASVTQTSQVLSSALTSTAYVSGSTGANYTITGLKSVNTYDVYCAVASSSGYSSTDAHTVQTLHTITTDCCKQVTFTNAPTYVYGSLAKYSASTPTAQYVFTYTLSSNPLDSVTITPTLYDAGGAPSADLAVAPASATFTAASTGLSASFVLSGTALIAGTYTIKLVASGPSASAQFYATYTQTTVNVLNSASMAPTPSVVSAKWGNSGGTIDVAFSGNTDKGTFGTASFTCTQLFTFLGSDRTTCAFTSASTVRITFKASEYGAQLVAPDGTVTLRANLLKAYCVAPDDCSFNQFAAEQTVQLTLPDSPPVPSVVLRVPSVVSGCDDVQVDPSLSGGAGGRAWKSVQWAVSVSPSSAADVSAILALFNGYGPRTDAVISISKALLPSAEYTVSLTLTNVFDQVSSATAVFKIDGNPNLPLISILGSGVVSVVPNDVLTLYTSTARSSCYVSASTVSYKWTVYKNGVAQPSIVSTSTSPTKFTLAPYALSMQTLYTVVFEATATATSNPAYPAITSSASVTVQVGKGAIVAVVLGGSFRSLAQTTGSLLLDASKSYDQSYPLNSVAVDAQLAYVWTCTSASSATYGSSCAEKLPVVTTASTLAIDSAGLVFQELYQFKVSVTATDGRSSSYTVTVQNSAGNTKTSINNVVLTKVNPTKKVVLTGTIQASYALAASWTAMVDGVTQPFTASTPLSGTFSSDLVSSALSYPLSVPGNTFPAGSTVVFRLTARQAGTADTFSSYSDITINMNAPPSGGSVASDPLTGYALSTTFSIAALSWNDDPADFPLSYEFTYLRVASQNALTLQSRTSSNKVSTTLPAGLSSAQFIIAVKCSVYDNFLAAGSATVGVNVTTSAEAVDVSAYVAQQVAASLAAGNSDQITQAIANAASSVNVVDCSLAPPSFCEDRGRLPCASTAQTCSACMDGFIGLAGDRNTYCREESEPEQAAVGGACAQDKDCSLGKCTDSVCVAPVKACPSDTAGVCSGHGTCMYTTSAGASYGRTCLETDSDCVAKCSCDTNYGGKTCGITADILTQRDRTRAQLCAAVITVSQSDDVSYFLMDSLISALYSCYDPDEVLSADAVTTCYAALGVLSGYATDGFLSEESTTLMVSVSSKFAQDASRAAAASGSASSTGRRLTSAADAVERAVAVDQSVSGIIAGILKNMANGQDPVNEATDDMQLMVYKGLASELPSLQPPQTEDQELYGTGAASSLEITDNAKATLTNDDGYVQVSLANWGVNPFPSSDGIVNTIARLEVVTDLEPARRLQEAVRNGTEPDFFVVIQFLAEQHFNFSLSYDQALIIQPDNFTVPECRYFNGSHFTHCDGCWVADYTNWNVTYGCPLSFLDALPDVVSTSRRLQTEHHKVVNFGTVVSYTPIAGNYRAFAAELKDKAVIAFMGALSFVVLLGFYYFRMRDLYDEVAQAVAVPIGAGGKGAINIDFGADGADGTLQYDGMFETAAKRDEKTLSTPAAVANFLDTVMPEESLLSSAADSPAKFLTRLLQNHDYTAVLFGPAKRLGRTLRFAHITLAFLLNLFFDCIFFGNFFPDGGTCERYGNSADCLAADNHVTDTHLCKWSDADGGHCAVSPPPRDFVFVIIVALSVVVVSVPVLFVYDYLIENICALRPSWERPPPPYVLQPTAPVEGELVYDNMQSPTYEADDMLLEVKDFLNATHFVASSSDNARAEAIQRHVGVYPSGQLAPRAPMDELLHGSMQHQLTARIAAAHASSVALQQRIHTFTHAEKQLKESTLIHEFVMEQFSPFKQFLLRRHLNAPQPSKPATVNPVLWVAAWTFVVLSIAFLLFWGFWWGARQHGHTSAAWGIVLGITLAQEIFVLQVLRVLLINYVSIFAVRPQLQNIYRALNKVAVSSVQDEVTTCVRVCQHLSPALRAAHTPVAKDLVAARILRHVDDADVAMCRTNSNATPAASVYIMLGLPSLFALLHDSFGSLAMQWWFPALFDAVLVMHCFFWKQARWWFFLPYSLLIVGYIYKYLVHRPARADMVRERHAANAYALTHWSESRRGSARRPVQFRFHERLVAFTYYASRPAKALDAVRRSWYAVNEPSEDAQWAAMNRPARVQAFVSLLPTEGDDAVSGTAERVTSAAANAAHQALRATIPLEVEELLCTAHEDLVRHWAVPAAESVHRAQTEAPNTNYFLGVMHRETKVQVHLQRAANKGRSAGGVNRSFSNVSNYEILTDAEDAVALVLRTYREHVDAEEMKLVDPEDLGELHDKDHTQCDVLLEFYDLRIVLEEVLHVYQPQRAPLTAEEKDELVDTLYAWLEKHGDAFLVEHYHNDTNRIAAATLASLNRSRSEAQGEDPALAATNFAVPFQQFRAWFLSSQHGQEA